MDDHWRNWLKTRSATQKFILFFPIQTHQTITVRDSQVRIFSSSLFALYCPERRAKMLWEILGPTPARNAVPPTGDHFNISNGYSEAKLSIILQITKQIAVKFEEWIPIFEVPLFLFYRVIEGSPSLCRRHGLVCFFSFLMLNGFGRSGKWSWVSSKAWRNFFL